MAKPPGITLLFGEVIPPLGGDTCFASLEHTYRSLTPRMQELLAGLIGIHSGKGVVAVNAVHKHLGIREDAARVDDIETEHPVVCVHPVTGRHCVFIRGVLNRSKGMSKEESKPIIDFLIAPAIRPENTCRALGARNADALGQSVRHAPAINDYAAYRRHLPFDRGGWVPQAAPAEAPADRAACSA